MQGQTPMQGRATHARDTVFAVVDLVNRRRSLQPPLSCISRVSWFDTFPLHGEVRWHGNHEILEASETNAITDFDAREWRVKMRSILLMNIERQWCLLPAATDDRVFSLFIAMTR